MAIKKSYNEPGLKLQKNDRNQLGVEDSTSHESNEDLYADEANSFIGGSVVISKVDSKAKRTSGRDSFDDEESEAGETADLQKRLAGEHEGPGTFAHGSEIKENENDVIEYEEGEESGMASMNEKASPKVFNFSLPFGGKNLLPVSPFSSIRAFLSSDSVRNDDTDGPITDDKTNVKLDRHQIKLKLKRQESISSVEERLLFANNKKIQNVRSKAVKNALKPDTLINAIKSFSATDHEEVTEDGYSVSRLEGVWDELEGDVVILGGYRGSILRSAETMKRVWIPIKAGFNIRKVNLLLGPKEEDELCAADTIIPDGMLTHIGPIDVARKLIRRLRMNPNVNIQDFGYDWRLSLGITASQLKDRLQQLYDRQEVKKGTFIIAHSMGGLLAHKVLQDFTHLVRGIIYVGSPSQCPNILGPFRFGDEVILNKSILNAESNFFMRSSFYFLPNDGRCFINKDTYEQYNLDFFDPEVWREYGLSPLVSKERENKTEIEKVKDSLKLAILSPVKMIKSSSNLLRDDTENDFNTSFEDSFEYLKRILPKTKDFIDKLQYDPEKSYPPLAIVYGDRVPTVRGAKVKNLDEIKKGLYQEFYYGPGDGVVHHKWLLPENHGFPVVAKIASEMPHVSLMTDFEAISKAFISILDAEQQTDGEDIDEEKIH
ncbi:unnamed protein product [Kluyveromyces dobzhanskii CBS 2104]|uniref:WGS project CCBQ000000000 data, contig MAT n=1 Tax=Kluyveromyces dobzhanskii CBS 2104 TaxID=1427455 RepID=A0A0A8L1R7_9SACH|nr:unnamed protein product [Kluyveromyces dobzhanskii CBS 2104]